MQIEVTDKASDVERRMHAVALAKAAAPFRNLTPLAAAEELLATRNFSLTVSESETAFGGVWASLLNRHLFIEIFWVSPGHQRKGVGRKLIDELERLAESQGCFRMVVSTFAFYGALPFWKKVGFSVTAELPGRSEPETLYYLKKDLSALKLAGLDQSL